MSMIRWALALLILESTPCRAGEWSLSADYTAGFTQGDPVASIGLTGSDKVAERWGWFVSQSLLKNFIVDSSLEEWELNDSVLGLELFPRTLISSITWKIRLSMTLPVSKSSQANEMYSRPEIRSTGSYALTEWLQSTGAGFFRYTLSRYQTTRGISGQGGDPLPWFSFGCHGGLQSTVWESVHLSAHASYFETKYYDVEYEGSAGGPVSVLPDQGYSLALSARWLVFEKTSLGLSYSQGSLLQQSGFQNYLIFDSEQSLWSIGITQTF
jgi:hypothetical protein